MEIKEGRETKTRKKHLVTNINQDLNKKVNITLEDIKTTKPNREK